MFSIFLKRCCVFLLCSAAIISTAYADTQIVWQGAPIQIHLPIGKGRFVSFPESVNFGDNQALLPSSTLYVANDDHSLYFLAKKSFQSERVEAKLSSGKVLLLDVSANKQASDQPINITIPGVINQNKQNGQHVNINYVSLIRYAAQQLYAPKYVLKSANNITRFPMDTAHVVPLFYDRSASAMPLASWHGGNLYVTALLIKNLLSQPLSPNPKLLCGNWKAVSFFPKAVLAAHGTPVNQDTTTLFAVSSQPFSSAIKPCL